MKEVLAILTNENTSFQQVSNHLEDLQSKNEHALNHKHTANDSARHLLITSFQGDVQFYSPSYNDEKQKLVNTSTTVINGFYDATTAPTNCHHEQNSCKTEQSTQDFTITSLPNLKSLKGNFSVLSWDESTQSLIAALSPFSTHALYYYELEGGIVVASNPRKIGEPLGFELKVNKQAISLWLSGRPDPNLSMFNDVKLLPHSHCLTFSLEKGLAIEQYWGIDSSTHIKYQNDNEYTEHFLSLLNSSVGVGVNKSRDTFFTQMSGGMDSTSITAIAKRLADKSDKNLRTVSHTYKNTVSCNEIDNIQDMISTFNLQDSQFVELDKFNDISFSELYPTHFDNPGIVLSPKYREELSIVRANDGDVLLTGNGGDETCWGHSASYRTRLRQGELGVIPEVIEAAKELEQPVVKSLYQLFIAPTMSPGFLSWLNRLRGRTTNGSQHPQWLTEEALSLIEDSNTRLALLNPFDKDAEPGKYARYIGVHTTSTYNAMRSYEKVAQQYGVHMYHPFFDADIVDFSFAVPEKMLIQGIYPKWLLRQSMSGVLPDSVCWKKQKVVFDNHFANLVRANKDELRALLSHEGLQELGLVDNAVLLSMFNQVVEREQASLNVDLLYAILTQQWFQAHHC